MIWWTWSGSNRRPLPCHGSALPAAPQAHARDYPIFMDGERFVNQPEAAPVRPAPATDRSVQARPARRWQPRRSAGHRHRNMSLVCAAVLFLLAAWSPLMAQAAPAAAGSASFTSAIRPALGQVNDALNGINIHKWKAPNEVRSAAEEDVSSIQRDLTGTLAGLMQASDANPESVPAAFAVYRNLDALYDTLLRVVET